MLNDIITNDNFKYLEAPAFDEPLDESAESVGDYFKRIREYIIFFNMSELDDYSSDELHKAKDALSDLWDLAQEMNSSILKLHNDVENLAYDREDEESERADAKRIHDEHVSYMQSYYNSTRM